MNPNHNLLNVASPSTESTASSLPTDSTPSRVAAIADRLRDCIGSEDYVTVILALVATCDPAAIPVLAALLDSVGPIAEESIAGLLTFGDAVVPAMRGCVHSLDYDMIRHGHQVLAALGDAASKEWLRDDRAECIAAYGERVGFPDLPGDALVANETDEPSEVA
jgi:hypothetical protein